MPKNAGKSVLCSNFQTDSDKEPGMNTFQKEQEQTVTLVSFSGLHLFLLKSYRIFQKQLILGHEIQKDHFYRNKHLLATTRFWFGFLHFQSKEIEITYLVATLRSNYVFWHFICSFWRASPK